MTRKISITSAIAGGTIAAISCLAPVPSTAQTAILEGPVVQWDMALFGTPRSGTRVFEEVAKMVSAATGGKFTIKLQYGEILAPTKEILDGISIGAFQSGWVGPVYAPGKQPVLSGLDLPILPVTSMKALAEVQHAYITLPEVETDFKRWNTKYIALATLPLYEFAGKGQPLQTLDDFKGKRIRALGGLADVVRLVGAVPTTVPSPEVYGAFQRGMFDALGFPYYAIASFKVSEIGEWYTKGFAFSSVVSYLGVGNKAFDALPPAYQKLLVDTGPKAAQVGIDEQDEGEAKAEAEFKARGMKTIAIAPRVREALIELTRQPVFDKWVQEITAKGYPGQMLLDFLIARSKKASS